MSKNFLLIALFALGFSGIINAQDIMYLRNKQVLEVKIIEVGLEEIKYKNYPADVEEAVIVIDKQKVEKIQMENGKLYEFATDAFNDKDMYLGQKNRSIETNFFSPLNGMFTVGYEQSIKPGHAFEVELGIIGIGMDPAEINPGGVMVRGGYKFTRTPDFYVRSMRYSHIMKGAYIKPEIVLASYAYDADIYDPNTWEYSTSREKQNSMAFMINFGKQWVYGDSFLIDLYTGVGYGGVSNDSVETGNIYGFIGGMQGMPLAFTAGLKIGLLFGK
jgi:hypothetical protein